MILKNKNVLAVRTPKNGQHKILQKMDGEDCIPVLPLNKTAKSIAKSLKFYKSHQRLIQAWEA